MRRRWRETSPEGNSIPTEDMFDLAALWLKCRNYREAGRAYGVSGQVVRTQIRLLMRMTGYWSYNLSCAIEEQEKSPARGGAESVAGE